MKIIFKSLVIIVFPIIIIFILFTGFLGGGTASASTAPIEPPATPEKSLEYAMLCSELGVPYSIVITTDAMTAYANGEPDIEDYNPLKTALEFMVITEIHEEYQEVDEDENGEPIYAWVTIDSFDHEGKTAVFTFTDYQDDDLEDLTPNLIVTRIQELEDEANGINREELEEGEAPPTKIPQVGDIRYTYNFHANIDNEKVLREFLLVNEKTIKEILDLNDAKYLEYLYFDDVLDLNLDYDLPDITVGNVTRAELVQVAGSIINHPYYWAGKYFAKGIPPNGLDCSGYVDWVYYQCFGKGVSGSFSETTGWGTSYQYYACQPIKESDLKIGDIAFYKHPKDDYNGYNHVGIYIGNNQWIHAGGSGFGTPELPRGRVGISNNFGGNNNNNPINGIAMVAPMYSTKFVLFARPQFQFADDVPSSGNSERETEIQE